MKSSYNQEQTNNTKKTLRTPHSEFSSKKNRLIYESNTGNHSNTSSSNNYFRIIVRPKEEFVAFRSHDIGKSSGLLRVAGRRKTGAWDTQAWLISKNYAHQEDDYLIADTEDTQKLMSSFEGAPVRIKDDVYVAEPM